LALAKSGGRANASNRFSGSQRFGTDYFSVEAQCIAPLRHHMNFIEPSQNFHAFALKVAVAQIVKVCYTVYYA
jgi:hypothetical protein